MDKIIFERGKENGDEPENIVIPEPKRVIFEIESGISIYEFRDICKWLALAVGYQKDSIDEVFGDDDTDEKEIAIQAHIHDLLKQDVVEKFVSGSDF